MPAKENRLTLILPADGDVFGGEVIERRLHAVARALGVEGRVVRNKI